ncbi:MAG: hypothetical protein Q8L77_01780 [Nitrospirota bacterium]|nr:hypothetical protein [Nitrospirota bacterium]
MPNSGPSILADVNDIIDEALRLKDIGKRPFYKHKTSCQKLSKSPVGLNIGQLPQKIYEQLVLNWNTVKNHQLSEENWRFEKQRAIGKGKDKDKDKDKDKNVAEVALERAIVNIPKEIWPDADSWMNQIPTSSGFMGPRVDKRRAIDLAYRREDGSYELIELKVGESGGTPLFAAMEILQYGLLYVFAREHKEVSKFLKQDLELLRAECIHLKVLAPPVYYKGYDFAWLEKDINRGLVNFRSQRKFSFEMDFKFETLALTLTRSSPWVPDGPKRTSP